MQIDIDKEFIIPGINNEDVAGFKMTRSPTDRNLFNVAAYGHKDGYLVTLFANKKFEEASALTEVLNVPYQNIPQVFETKEVQMPDGSIRYFQVEA